MIKTPNGALATFKNLSDDILCRFPVVRKKVLLDPTMPEMLRRKAAVLTLEDFFIKDSLTRVNNYLPSFSTQGNFAFDEDFPGLRHGIITSSNEKEKRVEFYWFGKSHGMEICGDAYAIPRWFSAVSWHKHGRRHGPSSIHFGYYDREKTIPRFKASFYENGKKFDEKETSEPRYKGSTSFLTKEAAKTVFRYARDQMKLKLK